MLSLWKASVDPFLSILPAYCISLSVSIFLYVSHSNISGRTLPAI
jgi:hypothetical protein